MKIPNAPLKYIIRNFEVFLGNQREQINLSHPLPQKRGSLQEENLGHSRIVERVVTG